MTLLSRFGALRDAYASLGAVGHDPFSVRFDRILSPTEGIFRGRPTLLFGSNNYLGLTFDADCIAAATAALHDQGTGTTGSRIANGSYSGHCELERRLAAFYDRRSAIVFTTGYQANLGLLSTLVGPDDHLLIDADSHASIYDGSMLGHAKVTRFRHNDPNDLARRLRRLDGHGGNKLIVVEGIYSMLGDTAPLREIAAVKRDAGAYLLVDEAHSLGVLGATGRGLCEAAGVEGDVDVIVGTFSKSLGAIGGFCVSDLPDFDILRVASRPYMFTASLPPSVVASSIQALQCIQDRPELRVRLTANARTLYDGLADAGFALGPEPNPIIAVRMPDADAAIAFWNALLDAGVYLNLALPPATPDGEALLRSSVSAAHTPAQIAEAVEVLVRLGRDLDVLPRRRPAARASTGGT